MRLAPLVREMRSIGDLFGINLFGINLFGINLFGINMFGINNETLSNITDRSAVDDATSLCRGYFRLLETYY